jgi:lipopolysaccharide exporter
VAFASTVCDLIYQMSTIFASLRNKTPRFKRRSQENLTPLSARVRKGALWSIANAAVLRLTSILITAVVARILDPHDFGVFAIALAVYTIVVGVGELGISSCLMRADLDIDFLAPTMVTVSVTTSVIQAAAMFAFAGPIAAALGSADAAGPIRVMALVVIIAGIFTVPSAQLVREFRQDKLFLSEVAAFVCSSVVLVLLAKSGSGAMAFAWSRVVGQFISGCVVFASVPKNYRPGFTRRALSPLLRIGVPLGAANFINYIVLNVDYALVGRLLGAVALGTYVLAFNVASWPGSLLGFMINMVSMPAFSRVKDDVGLLRNAIVSSVRALSLVVMPISGMTAALALPLVLTLYGTKWSASANVLVILALYGAISIICVLFANILAALDRSRFVLVVQLIWIGALIPAMVLGVHEDGIVGAAVAHIVVIGAIVLPSYLIALKRATGIRLTTLAIAVLPAPLAALAAGLLAKEAASRFTTPIISLTAGLAVGGLIYVIATAPQIINLLSRGQNTNPLAGRVLSVYTTAARALGIPVSSQPRHSVKSGIPRPQQASDSRAVPDGPHLGLGQVIETPIAYSAQSAAAALAVLMSLAKPEPVASPMTSPIPRIAEPMDRDPRPTKRAVVPPAPHH